MNGKYIVIEGGEGVGKTTQADLLIRKLSERGIEAVYMQEPGSTTFAKGLRILIKSETSRTPKTNVLAFNAARAETMSQIEQVLATGRWVISDRSYLSTIVYQGYGEGQNIEEIRAVCKYAVTHDPDITFILDSSPESNLDRISKRGEATDYFENMQLDFHQRIRQGYLTEAQIEGLPIIDGNSSVTKVSGDIWKYVENYLGSDDYPKSKSKSNNPLIKKNKKGKLEVTPAGKNYLSTIATNVEDNVYVFKDTISPVTVAAGMARLSRRADDMRITILDEFSGTKGKDEELIHRVITAYGDDSVQQLVGLQAVVENASNLLTKKLEWGRLAAYLEQSTRYIFFDEKTESGKYRYYTPSEFDATTTEIYENTINQIFEIYSEMVHRLTDYVRSNSTVPEKDRDIAWKGATKAQACDAVRNVLPVATTSTVGIFASGQAFESLIMHLLADELLESKSTGSKLLNEGRKIVPTFLERADKPDRGGARVAYMANTRASIAQIVEDELPQRTTDYSEAVRLEHVSTRNEFDLIPYMLYDQSELSLNELRSEVNSWNYDKKLKTFNAYMGERLNRRHKPGRALEHIEYHFDLICDYGIFRDLQRHRMVEGLEWQHLTPRYGYEVPKLIEEAGLTDMFEQCFDLSYQLHSRLQALGYYEQSQYAVLMGHKMRWKIAYNARQAFHFHELRTTPQGHPGYRKLVNEMHEKIAEVHPLLAGAMKFVNQDEDPELSRLAAEKYTQYKLDQLRQD